MNFFKLMYLLPCWSFSNAQEPAVFFEFGQKKLVEMNENIGEATCEHCLNACSATPDSPTLEVLNDNISITGNGIFLRDIYPEHTAAKDMRTEVCGKPYTPALVYDNAVESYEVGYELYYMVDQVKLKSSWYYQYFKVADGKIKKRENPRKENLIKIKERGGNTVFEIVDESSVKYTFYWISVLSIEMRNAQKHRIVTYAADIINDFFLTQKIKHKCQIYYSGDGRTIPDENSEKGPGKVINGLVITQIIPMYMFHSTAARLATCMYLNFAFVRETIAKNQLKKIDLFLYALYRERPLVTALWFGINDNLHGVQPIAWNETTSDEKVFKSPVPKVVFRFILIHLGEYRYFGAAVILHNYLERVEDTDRICSGEEELKSWGYLKNTDSATGFSYVCPLTDEVVAKLKGNPILALQYSQPLEITEFPSLNRITKQIRKEDALEKILKRFQEIQDMVLD